MIMPSSPTYRQTSVRRHLLAFLLSFSLILPLTPLARLLSVPFIPAANAASFTSGNVVVYRCGDGAAGLSSNATAVFLDEYTPAGALVQSIALPTSASGANKRLTSSGTATSEGFLSRSVDGRYIILSGYEAAPGAAGIASTTTATASRVIGRVDAAGNVDTSTALTDAFSGGNIRSATSTNGTDLWATGSNTGVRYATLGSLTSTSVSTAVTNLRQTNIFNNQLYVSSGSGTTRLAPVGRGIP